MSAIASPVYNRGTMPPAFAAELVAWAKNATDDIFAPNQHFDIYSKVKTELGPYRDLLHRKAVMLEVMRVLAGFESSWNWKEGIDASRSSATTNENAEAGAWQVSYDARKLDPSLLQFLEHHEILTGHQFQTEMKLDHPLAMEFIVRLLRIEMRNYERIANGPVRKGIEREKTWPSRPKLRDAKESIYPWLSRDAAAEFVALLG